MAEITLSKYAFIAPDSKRETETYGAIAIGPCYVNNTRGLGTALYTLACQLDLEGIVANTVGEQQCDVRDTHGERAPGR